YAVLSKDRQKVVKCAFELMKRQLASNKFDKEATGKEKSTVKEALNTLLPVVINQPMRPILKDLGLEFGLLAFNWNKVFGKRPDIAAVVVTIKNVVEKTLSLMEAIDIIKSLTNRVRDMERFSPPAFELSKHYLKSLGGD
ncbi:unnamed protein product, partial [marine sediment metagenome]